MNIIYCHCHDLGTYFDVYGHHVGATNLLDFSKESIVFNNCHTNGPTCSPSRASLLTSMCAHSNGMVGLAHLGFSIINYDKHLAKFLGKNGYKTALFGIEHEGAARNKVYDEIYIPKYESSLEDADMESAKNAAKYISNHKNGKFFLSCGFFYPHREYLNDIEDIDINTLEIPAILPNCPETRKDYAMYSASVRAMDKSFGIIYDALKKSSQLDNTIFIFTTDHGIAFPFMKCHLYDTGTNVALLMKIPNYEKRRINSLISNMDIFPTLCDLLDLDKPSYLQGKSYKPILDNETDEINDYIFSEINYHVSYEPMRSIRSKRYKYIKSFDNSYNMRCLANIDDGYTKTYLLDNGFKSCPHPKEELFDLILDPCERNNLINNIDYSSIKKTLKDKLQDNMEKTNDPLLTEGHVKSPKDATIMPKETLSPKSLKKI